ncbi:MAG: hypothetical protein HY235_29460 [Acidobacteria bacterium]|nr:hypothetical protein [Acidobacteriota bacterium]
MPRTIEIPVSDDLLRLLDEKARRSGLKREDYVSALLSKDLAAPPTLAQVLKPFREQVAASGVTDDELGQLFTNAREDAHGERRP